VVPGDLAYSWVLNDAALPYLSKGGKTMSHLIEIPYGDGKTILVEVRDVVAPEVEELGRMKPRAIEKVDQNLEAVSAIIVETSQIMIGAFQSIATLPKTEETKPPLIPAKATLEFGVSFTAEGDIYVVKASGEATLKAIVEWEFKSE